MPHKTMLTRLSLYSYDEISSIFYQVLIITAAERTITVTSSDPYYITPAIKAKLRRKNRLRRAGRVEEADALAAQISRDIANRNKTRLSKIHRKTSSKDLWAAVRQLTGGRQTTDNVEGITAESLNKHYAHISTDTDFQIPQCKHTAACRRLDVVSEWQVFRMLDTLRNTSTGLDNVPAWFLRLGAPVFCKPVALLYNKSISTSVVPRQWKSASIRPVPKNSAPVQHSDFRPISITPVLCRTLERVVVRTFLYPAILMPPAALHFSDQFAFCPTGSTTAALITLLQTISDTYVVVIALDFSKAFDTVRQANLLRKIALLNIPDPAYNWLVDVFSDHTHCTRLSGLVSGFQRTTASIIQGSAVDPVSFVINASDLSTVTPGNRMIKYADAMILIPACNILSRVIELEHVAEWAHKNNLKLNSLFQEHHRLNISREFTISLIS